MSYSGLLENLQYFTGNPICQKIVIKCNLTWHLMALYSSQHKWKQLFSSVIHCTLFKKLFITITVVEIKTTLRSPSKLCPTCAVTCAIVVSRLVRLETTTRLEYYTTYLPIQTSPNCPAPSFFTIFNVSLGISHSSWPQGLWGAADLQGVPSLWHRPSADPANVQSKNRWKDS